PSLLVEAVLDLGDAPHDALAQEGFAPDPAEANRDPARGRRIHLVLRGRLERRRARPEEAGWIRGAKEATFEHQEPYEEPVAAPHRPFAAATPSPCRPGRGPPGSRSRESARVPAGAGASRVAPRLAWYC